MEENKLSESQLAHPNSRLCNEGVIFNQKLSEASLISLPVKSKSMTNLKRDEFEKQMHELRSKKDKLRMDHEQRWISWRSQNKDVDSWVSDSKAKYRSLYSDFDKSR